MERACRDCKAPLLNADGFQLVQQTSKEWKLVGVEAAGVTAGARCLGCGAEEQRIRNKRQGNRRRKDKSRKYFRGRRGYW